MKLARDEIIGGERALVVRDLMREVSRGDAFETAHVAEYLAKVRWREHIDELVRVGTLPAEQRGLFRRAIIDYGWAVDKKTVEQIRDQDAAATPLIEALLKGGLIEECEPPWHDMKGTWYKTTMAGNAASMARFIRRMDRAQAEALLKSVLERVASANADPKLLHFVTEVRVFGSCTDAADSGDQDVAIKLERREVEGDWVEAVLAMAKASGQFTASRRRASAPEAAALAAPGATADEINAITGHARKRTVKKVRKKTGRR